MRIVTLDLSLTGTGWAVFGTNPKLTAFGTLVIDKKVIKAGGMNRFSTILRLLKSKCANASFVVIEDLAHAAKDRNHERAGLAWTVRYLLWQAGIPFVLVAPTTLKKFMTGKGNAEKSMCIVSVYKRWGMEATNDNEADAIGLLKIGKMLGGYYKPKHKYEHEELAVVQAALRPEMRKYLETAAVGKRAAA